MFPKPQVLPYRDLDLVVDGLDAGVRGAELDRLEYAVALPAHLARQLDELRYAAAARPGEPAVEPGARRGPIVLIAGMEPLIVGAASG